MRRYFTALLLTVIYLTVTMSPLAPLALQSPWLAHALTGECQGDCGICGCSAELRANHTCCCQQKKNKEARQKAVIGDCCKQQGEHRTVLACGCPCGSGKHQTLPNLAKSELIPFSFEVSTSRPVSLADYPTFHGRMSSRFEEPPEPPPRLTPSYLLPILLHCVNEST